jgi:hypothetical protein
LLILAIIALQTAFPFPSSSAALSSFSVSSSAFAQSQADTDDALGEEADFTAKVISLQQKKQREQSAAFMGILSFLSQVSQKGTRYRSTTFVSSWFFIRICSPRKLLPSATDIDPLLS